LDVPLFCRLLECVSQLITYPTVFLAPLLLVLKVVTYFLKKEVTPSKLNQSIKHTRY